VISYARELAIHEKNINYRDGQDFKVVNILGTENCLHFSFCGATQYGKSTEA
jgi:hypothetical protein